MVIYSSIICDTMNAFWQMLSWAKSVCKGTIISNGNTIDWHLSIHRLNERFIELKQMHSEITAMDYYLLDAVQYLWHINDFRWSKSWQLVTIVSNGNTIDWHFSIHMLNEWFIEMHFEITAMTAWHFSSPTIFLT